MNLMGTAIGILTRLLTKEPFSIPDGPHGNPEKLAVPPTSETLKHVEVSEETGPWCRALY